MKRREDVKIGDLVLIKDETLPPGQWSLGRIEEIHPGNDNIIRVVTLRTRNKLVKRPLAKICPLPVNEPEEKDNNSRPKRPLKDKEDAEEPGKRSSRPRKKVKINPVVGYSCLVKDNHPNRTETSNIKEGAEKQSTMRPQRMGNFTLMLILALLLVPILADHTQEFIEITPFKNHPGIYFEDVGHAHLIASEWDILIYYDLQQYWQELKGLRNCINEIHKLCNVTIIRRNYCIEIHAQFQRQLMQIEAANELIHKGNQNEENKLRRRRSPLNIIGKAANLLFGVLDSDYAEQLDKKLKTIDQNQDHLLQLIKNQTSVMEATTNIMKGRDESIQIQFKIIQDHIMDLERQIQQNGDNQEMAQMFNSITSHTTLVLHNFERVQQSITDVLTDLHHGRINPLLITPQQLKSQMRLARENIPSTLTLPENGQDTALLLYSLMTAAVRVMKTRIIFQIKLPLLQNEKYQLFHLVPVPTPHEGRFTFIEPETPYLIVNLHRDHYYPLTQFELDKCLHLEPDQYLCRKNHPIYNSNSERGRCELNLLRHVETPSSDCNIRTMKPSKIWIQLRSPNTWLYVMEKEYTFNLVCGSTVTSKTLNGEGILKLRPQCEIKQESMTISGHGLYTTQLNSSIFPSLNIS